jgi:hypothetical protein
VHTDLTPAECKVVPNDPLLYDTPLPLRRTLFPLGFPATIVTNCERIVATAEELWGRFEKTCDEPPIEIRLAVSESPVSGRPAPTMPRGQGHLLSTVHDASNFVVSDLRSGFGFGWLTPAVACDGPYVRYYFLEPHVMLLLQSRHLTPVHAGCVALRGRGVLLCGESEAGKTTLSYACARKGWTYVSDDGLSLIRGSSGRIVAGNPYQVRFRPPAKLLFPELSGYVPFERPNGKPSLEMDTALLNIAIAGQALADYLVFLNRKSSGGQRLVEYGREEALAQLEQVICVGEESLRAQQRESLRRLLSAPVYEMKYYDLDWAEQRLRALVDNGE